MAENTNIDKVRREGGVEIMKASAGSGKTFALAREYIRLLLSSEEPNAHRHILAVTFTNKATEEMKSRIIKELSILADNPSESGYRGDLDFFKSDEELKKKAAGTLKAILNDYSAFSVCTIDKFFQRTLRAFAREIGHMGEYQVELDRESLISESVDRLLDSITEGSGELRQMLSASSINSLESGDGYHLDSDLRSFAKSYMSEAYADKLKQYGIDEEKAFSEENIASIHEICDRICREFDEDFTKAVKKAKDYLEGLVEYDKSANSYFRNRLDEFSGYKPGQTVRFRESAVNWQKAVADGRNVFKADAGKKVSQDVVDCITSLLQEVDSFYEERYKLRRTAEILRRQVDMFRIAKALKQQFDELLSEKNVLGLEDTNSILRDLISNTDAPFIYEKLGVQYQHFLLDEFQDTSTVQWENFLPLLRQSISSGCYNLVVGDVKQSIYRWRSADWNILDSQVESRLDRPVVNPLDSNWRSAHGIVGFNNAFFKWYAPVIDDNLAAGGCGASARKVKEIYSDVQQYSKKKSGVPGSVELTFCDSKLLCPQVVEAVSAALDRNFRYRDIAVLVRNNKMGGKIAAALNNVHIPVISNDSLRICSCDTVRTLVARLFLLDDPKDVVNAYYAGDFDPVGFKGSGSLSDMVEKVLEGMPAEQVEADTVYVLAFMDILHDFMQLNGNSLHAFLRFWKEEGVKKTISSPSGSDAVTITTVHKSKGLDYPCVIIPLPEKDNKSEESWEPMMDNDAFSDVEKALYNIKISSGTKDTLFGDSYVREQRMLEIDDINTWYVAMTRASEAMHVIAPAPAKDLKKEKIGNVAGALYIYAGEAGLEKLEVKQPEAGADGKVPFLEKYIHGTLSCKEEKPEKKSNDTEPAVRTLVYKALPSDVVPKVRPDAKEFFSADDNDIYASSPRMRGVVLHGIMEHIFTPEDIHEAVAAAVMEGKLNEEEAAAATAMLSRAVASVADRGWFTADRSGILDERDIATGDVVLEEGRTVVRPDRVIIRDGGVDIVDYKFGYPKDDYARQVSEYVSLYRKMGYANVHGYIWYVHRGRIDEV